jgi:hypothetical protein
VQFITQNNLLKQTNLKKFGVELQIWTVSLLFFQYFKNYYISSTPFVEIYLNAFLALLGISSIVFLVLLQKYIQEKVENENYENFDPYKSKRIFRFLVLIAVFNILFSLGAISFYFSEVRIDVGLFNISYFSESVKNTFPFLFCFVTGVWGYILMMLVRLSKEWN